MNKKQMKKGINPLKDKDGVVLVMVLLVLMATIVIGIFLARTSFLETKIAGNEKNYKQTVYTLESSTDWVMQNSSPAFGSLGLTVYDQNNRVAGDTYTYTTGLPNMINGATITVRLTRIMRPPLGSGTDPARFRARYYSVSSAQNGYTLTIGAYKMFPKQ
jgi:hypothetical protein